MDKSDEIKAVRKKLKELMKVPLPIFCEMPRLDRN